MEKKSYKNYFLGLASKEDAETIELQIIADEKLEGKLLQAENDLIEDFLDGNLTNEEIQAFNANFLVTDERRERVEFVKTMSGYTKDLGTKIRSIKETKPSFFDPIKAFMNPRKFALGFGGIALILTIGFISYLGWKNYSDSSVILASLNKAYKNDRPTEARISGFDYAPKTEGTRGNTDKTQDLNLVYAKSRAAEAALKNETAENLHELGRVYLAEKNFDEAIKQFEKATKKNPNIAELHNDLGVALMEKAKQKEEGKLELFAKANEEIEKSIELDKTLTAAYFNRGLVIESLNLTNQAKEAWDNYLKLDSSSQWADEARKHLQKIEENKPISKTKEEVLQEFLQAKQTNDTEKAWQTLSRNREMITGKLIPQQLAFLFVDSKSNGDEAKAEECLDALVYVGKLEEEKSGDLFWRDLANYYKNLNDNKFKELKETQNLLKDGYQLRQSGNLGEAIKKFREAKSEFIKENDIPGSLICEYWIATLLFQLNEVEQSNSIQISLATYAEKNNYKWMATQSFVRLGYGMRSENMYSRSIEFNEKALKYSNETQDTYNLQRIFTSLAYVYRILGQFEKSFGFSEKSLNLQRFPESSPRQKWLDYEAITQTLFSEKLFRTAILFQEEALSLDKIIKDEGYKQTSNTYLGMLYTATKDFEKADWHLQESIGLAENFTDEQRKLKALSFSKLMFARLNEVIGNVDEAISIYKESNKFNLSSEFQLDSYQGQKGELLCYLAKNDIANFETKLPIVLKIFNEYKGKILEEQSRNSFFDKEQDVYDIAIEYEFRSANYSKAFDYAEESRARSLLDLQNSVAQISLNEKQPEIKLSSNSIEPLGLTKIQLEMPENAQFLAYAVLSKRVLIWVITKNNIEVEKTDISFDNLQEKVSTYLELISKQSDELKILELSKELFNILILPVKDKLDSNSQIFIIPDKILFRLPFATLYSDKYLLEDYKITYTPSANVFLNCFKNAKEFKEKKAEKLLSIGNPDFNPSEYESNLPTLPSAKSEAEEIAKFYLNRTILTENNATKEKVQTGMQDADVIHFAGHYVIDEKQPLLSSLILAGKNKTQSNLANYEIVAEKFTKTRLIILSACDTEIERYYKGEGIIGASRTFLATGIPLVVASQWSVDSEATKELMIRFHQLRKTQMLPTSEALRQSQIEMLQKEKYKQPYYWAAFSTLGGLTEF